MLRKGMRKGDALWSAGLISNIGDRSRFAFLGVKTPDVHVVSGRGWPTRTTSPIRACAV